jgi:hypothetical protein
MKTFLGGTCNGSTWRDLVMNQLHHKYFNPVVDDWTPECQERELEEREKADCCLYCITPKMTGTYSIAEVVDDSNKRPDKTVFVLMRVDGDDVFDDGQWKSLLAVSKLVHKNGGAVFVGMLHEACSYINSLLTRREGEGMKTLHNSDISGARKNVKDIDIVGNGDMFQLLCKASSEKEGWMKSTKAMEIEGVGCVVQVTTQQRNIDLTYSLAEAITFVPNVIICADENNGRKLIQRF